MTDPTRFLIPLQAKLFALLDGSQALRGALWRLSNFTEHSFHKSELLTIWLADKVLHTIHDEEYQIEALELALTSLRQNA